MPLQGDPYFPFNTLQRKTLARLFAEAAAGDSEAIAALEAELAALDARVTTLEDAAE